MEKHSEAEIIQGCINNSRKYQEVLYLKYFDKMFGMCLRHTDDQELAMSLLNDGFLKIFKNIGTFKGEGNLEGWIRKIIFNCIADHFRRKKNNIKYVELDDTRTIDESFNEFDFESIISSIKKLPEKDRRVFVLHSIEGYNHAEIAELLNISVGTSKWYLSSARTKLREILNKEKLNYYKS